MAMEMKIQKSVLYSRFLSNKNNTGGDRRTCQLLKAFSCFNPELVSVDARRSNGTNYGPVSERNVFKRLFLRLFIAVGQIHKKLLDLFIAEGEYWSWDKSHRAPAFFWRRQSRQMAVSIRNKPLPDLILLDDPIYFAPLARKVKRLKIPLVGLCHNIESLVYGQSASSRGKRKLFKKEMEVLTLCDYVVTISREDALLLNQFDIRAFYFPYYPTPGITADLLKVRQRRKTTVKKDYFLLGTAANLPTRTGMLKVIKTWGNSTTFRGNHRLIVAGYATDKLKEACHDPGVHFLGLISDEELYERLATVKALICYQEPTTGALTRITEALIAGVPVLANCHAARSNYHQKGIIEFLNLDEMGQHLSQIELEEGNIPVPEPPDNHALISGIVKSVHGRK